MSGVSVVSNSSFNQTC